MTESVNTDRTRRIKDILWVLTFFGIVGMYLRFAFGLGTTTALTDNVPWGLWKIFNMIAGAAVATSGFTVGFLGHVLRIEKFKKLVKPAITIAFLGYGASLFALLFDIGLPWRFWHPFVYWNIHSFLFEVFWCVSIYFCVTFIELSPTLLERIGLASIRGWLHKLSTVFVILGITLSSLHHTSLGSLFLVSPQRLHTLWYSPVISLFFIISAMGGGLMLLVLIKILYAYWYDPKSLFFSSPGSADCKTCVNPEDNGKARDKHSPEMDSISLLALVASCVLLLYLVLKIADLVLRPGAMSSLLEMTWESWLYILELVFSVVLPVGLIIIPSIRRSPVGLAVVSSFAVFGLVFNRINVGIFGYLRDAKEFYAPSLIEWAITFGVLSMAGLAFFFLVENFSIFDKRWKNTTLKNPNITSAFDRLTYVWRYRLLTGLERTTLIALVALPLAWITLYPPFSKSEVQQVQPPIAMNTTRTILKLDGNRAGVVTIFAHENHKKLLGGEESCIQCHHLSLPGDQATPCAQCHNAMEEPTNIFNHTRHESYIAESRNLSGWHPENHSCDICHEADQPKTASSAMGCFDCHEKDMNPVKIPEAKFALMMAPGYHQTMHQVCINCHAAEVATNDNKELADCITCHAVEPEEEVMVAGFTEGEKQNN